MLQANGDDVFDINSKLFIGPIEFESPINFTDSTAQSGTRANLGFSTNLNTLWTATNTSNARSAVGLGAVWLTNTNVTNFRTAIGFSTNLNALWTATNAIAASDALGFAFDPDEGGPTINAAYGLWDSVLEERGLAIVDGDPIFGSQGSNAWRIALGLGVSNIVTFAGITNNGDIRINQTATNNGLLYIYRTNSEAFLGLANLIASNNVTVSNETLFRVGVSEATNKAAQFGFRATNTNGNGVAVFSTFGNNALMMIGASDRSQGQAAIEADIWTISPTNRVMTLRDTNTGAMTMHRDIGFAATLTNAAPTNTNTPAVWLRVWVGTNNYRLPLYQ